MSTSEDLRADTITIAGHGGDSIEAYLARPLGDGARGGVVVIHHMPGYDSATKEITRRFAAHGFIAICPNLYSREAPGASPDDAAAAARALGGVPDERLVGDVAGAAAHLRSLAPADSPADGLAVSQGSAGLAVSQGSAGLAVSNGKVGVIGYCSGGRQSFLAACSLPLDAAVDCYGAYVVGTPAPESPLQVSPLLHLTEQLSCPLLGLFGEQDAYPSPAEVAELEQELTRLGKTFEFKTYPDAGHAFFAVNRPGYRVAAAVDGWQRVLDFFGRHLSA